MKTLRNSILAPSLIVVAVAIVLVSTSATARAESPNITIGPDMTIGSTGQGVVVLQGLLTELGHLNVPAGVPFGYFGPLTRDAVARYQASLGVSPTAGYFGPLTKIAMRTQFAPRGWLTLLQW